MSDKTNYESLQECIGTQAKALKKALTGKELLGSDWQLYQSQLRNEIELEKLKQMTRIADKISEMVQPNGVLNVIAQADVRNV